LFFLLFGSAHLPFFRFRHAFLFFLGSSVSSPSFFPPRPSLFPAQQLSLHNASRVPPFPSGALEKTCLRFFFFSLCRSSRFLSHRRADGAFFSARVTKFPPPFFIEVAGSFPSGCYGFFFFYAPFSTGPEVHLSFQAWATISPLFFQAGDPSFFPPPPFSP